MPVRNKIKHFIDSRAITRYQFTKDTGLSATTAYALYDNPWQVPHVTAMNKICDTYRVQPCELIEWVAPEDLEVKEDSNQ
uniref:DNA-binding protein n=2 Tax=Tolypothrix TaxID=111782 RepID=A0A0C1RDV1_9CYAN